MTGTAAGFILGFLLATIYSALFHFLVGGPIRRLFLYTFSAWLGFALGHIIGDWLEIDLLKLGALHLFSASLGTWVALIASWWLAQPQ